jgi:hypothetical protein
MRKNIQQRPPMLGRNFGGQDRMVPAQFRQGRADLLQGLALAIDHFADIGALPAPSVEGQVAVFLSRDRSLGRLARDVAGSYVA